jgi:hypothetical protein
MSPRISVVHLVGVYDGRRYLGEVAELANGQWGAYSPDAVRLGVFDKRDDAERLILSGVPHRNPGGRADG